MVATIARIFGPASLDVAEEVVQHALLQALQLWPFYGVPDNPRAWLVRVARNRGLDMQLLSRSCNMLNLLQKQKIDILKVILKERKKILNVIS